MQNILHNTVWSIIYDAMLSSLRNGTEKLIPKYFPDLMNSTRRIEFLPVEWRTDLQLDGGKQVDLILFNGKFVVTCLC